MVLSRCKARPLSRKRRSSVDNGNDVFIETNRTRILGQCCYPIRSQQGAWLIRQTARYSMLTLEA